MMGRKEAADTKKLREDFSRARGAVGMLYYRSAHMRFVRHGQGTVRFFPAPLIEPMPALRPLHNIFAKCGVCRERVSPAGNAEWSDEHEEWCARGVEYMSDGTPVHTECR